MKYYQSLKVAIEEIILYFIILCYTIRRDEKIFLATRHNIFEQWIREGEKMNIKHAEILKSIALLETELISTGILFLFIEGRTIKWKVASDHFDMDIFREGGTMSETSVAVRAMAAGEVLKESIPREVYGKRLRTTAIPLEDDNGDIKGAFSIIVPQLHPVAASFNDFAPIIVELFPEGAFIYLSDLTQIAYIRGSKKFTLSNMHVGYKLKETDMAYQTITTGKPQVRELGAERYGVPVYIANYPLVDDESQSIVATIGVVVPKTAASKLREFSESLAGNLDAIAKTVEHLAINASNINENTQSLFSSVNNMGTSLDASMDALSPSIFV